MKYISYGRSSSTSERNFVRTIGLCMTLAMGVWHQQSGALPPGIYFKKNGDVSVDVYTLILDRVYTVERASPTDMFPSVAIAIASSQTNYSNNSSGGGAGSGGVKEPGPEVPGEKNKDKPPPKNNTSPTKCADPQNSNPSTGSPVIISTGEKYKVEQDFAAGSDYALGLQRTYRSFDTNATMFGPKWLSSYDYPALNYSGCYRHPDYGNLCIPTASVFTTWTTTGTWTS